MPDEAERLLMSLVPASALDRDEVMFRAGQASARSWLWPALALLATATSVVLAVMLYLTPGQPPSTPRPVPVPAPAPPAAPVTPKPPPVPVFQAPARRLEEAILRDGLDALGPADPLPPAPKKPLLLGDI